MGWLQKLFGKEKPANAQVNPTPAPSAPETGGQAIPPERVGLSGEYDQSGLAKRVALAFDQDPELQAFSEDTVWIAQTGTTVVLKGKVPNQEVLSKMVSSAMRVNGASDVKTDEVSIG
jgi:osmotically-inducible protein OsmY